MDPETLELAHAAVAALQAATQPTWTDSVTAFATVVVGGTQCGLIWYGLTRMEETGRRREKHLDQQHQESMTALTALINRTAPKCQQSPLRLRSGQASPFEKGGLRGISPDSSLPGRIDVLLYV